MTKYEFKENLLIVYDAFDGAGLIGPLGIRISRPALESLCITGGEYTGINYVYTYHPSISDVCGKRQIAALFLIGGMPLIMSMQLDMFIEDYEQLKEDGFYGKEIIEDRSRR